MVYNSFTTSRMPVSPHTSAAILAVLVFTICSAGPTPTTATPTPASTTTTAATLTDPLGDPCQHRGGGGSQNRDVSPLQLLSIIGDKAEDIQLAASAFRLFLTGGENPRVTQAVFQSLDQFNVSVTNFPSVPSIPDQNVTAVLAADYVALAGLYVFYEQTLVNTLACDDRQDRAEAERKVRAVLGRTANALCTVDTTLRARGTPLPRDAIPGRSEVLGPTFPAMAEIPLTCRDSNASTAHGATTTVDYVNARDTERLAAKLSVQIIELHARLSG